jgi:AraC-like DNA-binding protein
VAEVALTDILEGMALKSHATALQTQNQQVKSRIAAIRSLNNRERKHTKVAEIEAILGQRNVSSQKPAKGQVPFLLWVGNKRAFVSKGFVPIGASQTSIASVLGISERTVRRHLDYLGIERCQIVQAKAAYQSIRQALEWEAPEWEAEPNIGYMEDKLGFIWLNDMNGKTSSRKPAQIITKERFFKYRGKTWIYRCNVYELDYPTTSMRASRDSYAELMVSKPRAGSSG